MKLFLKKFLPVILSLSMIVTTTSVFANEVNMESTIKLTPVEVNKVSIDIASNSSNIIIFDNGIEIDGKYYSQEDFIKLLDTSIQISIETGKQSRMAGLVAGTWFIPGIGQVVVTIAGGIIVAGATIAVGSWVYNTVVDWFANRALQANYEEDKKDGTQTDNHSSQTGGSLPTKGEPNSSKDLKDSEGTKQRRYYDKDGNADMDIDYRHGGNGKEPFPHRHDWNNGKRGSSY